MGIKKSAGSDARPAALADVLYNAEFTDLRGRQMKKVFAAILVTAIVSGTSALAVTGALSFKLINNTGKAITSVQIKHGDNWGSDVLKDGVLLDGRTSTITTKDTSGCEFDLRITYKGDSKSWTIRRANLCDISTITLHIRDGNLTYKSQK
jgi:hypothetical protein